MSKKDTERLLRYAEQHDLTTAEAMAELAAQALEAIDRRDNSPPDPGMTRCATCGHYWLKVCHMNGGLTYKFPDCPACKLRALGYEPGGKP